MHGMKIEWDDVRVFQSAVRSGGFTSAARTLDMDRTTVGRRFARLERGVGRALWEQVESGYRPTEAGQAVLRAAGSMEHAMARLGSDLVLPGEGLVGPVRVAGTVGIASLILPRVADFLAAHDQVGVELVGARDAIAAVHQRHADLGIAIARATPRDLAGVRVAPFEQRLYAVAGAPDRRVGWGHAVMLANPQPWARLNAAGPTAVEVDNYAALHDAVRACLGRAWLWRELADRDPMLRPFSDAPPAAAGADIWIVHRDDVATEPTVAALRDALAAALKD